MSTMGERTRTDLVLAARYAVLGVRFLRLYPTRSIVFAISLVVQLVVPLSLWSTLTSVHDASTTFGQLVSYTLTSVLLTELTFSPLVSSVGNRVNQGTLSNFFLKPVSALKLFLFHDVIQVTVSFTLPVIAVVASAGFMFRNSLILPATSSILPFMISILFAMAVRREINVMLAAYFIITSRGWGMSYMVDIIIGLLSGSVFPAILLPSKFMNLIGVLPFSALANTPALIETGMIPNPWNLLLRDLAWSTVMALLAWLYWRRAVKHLELQGG